MRFGSGWDLDGEVYGVRYKVQGIRKKLHGIRCAGNNNGERLAVCGRIEGRGTKLPEDEGPRPEKQMNHSRERFIDSTIWDNSGRRSVATFQTVRRSTPI